MPAPAGRGRGRRPLARRPRPSPEVGAGAPAALRRLVAAQGQAQRPASTRCSARCARSRRRPAARPGPGGGSAACATRCRRAASGSATGPARRPAARSRSTARSTRSGGRRWPRRTTRLAPAHDGRVLKRFAANTTRTRAIVVVRHASAGDKRAWPATDADRPLDRKGARAVGHDRCTPHGVRRGAGRQRRRAPLPRDPGPARPGRRDRRRGPPDHDSRRVRRRHGEGGPRGPGPGDEHDRGRPPGAASAR